jgi:hypothetical protein
MSQSHTPEPPLSSGESHRFKPLQPPPRPPHFAYLRAVAVGLDPIEPVPAMVLARLSGDLCAQVIRLRQRDPEVF